MADNGAPTGSAVSVGKRFVKEFQSADIPGLGAELAYRFLFSIFPFAIFVATLAAFVGPMVGIQDPTSRIMAALGDNLPPDVANQLRPQLEAVLNQTRPGLLSFGAIAALWAATGGTNALMKGSNRAYEVEETRPFVKKTALAIGLTLLATIGVLVAFVTIVGASLLTQEVAKQLGLNAGQFAVLSLLRWPVIFAFLAIAVGMLYRFAPNLRTPWRWCFAGGALFSLLWLVATAAFGLYVANFSNYGNTYGALGGVIVLMLWFYLTAVVLAGTALLIAVVMKERDPAAVEEARQAARSSLELRQSARQMKETARQATGGVAAAI